VRADYSGVPQGNGGVAAPVDGFAQTLVAVSGVQPAPTNDTNNSNSTYYDAYYKFNAAGGVTTSGVVPVSSAVPATWNGLADPQRRTYLVDRRSEQVTEGCDGDTCKDLDSSHYSANCTNTSYHIRGSDYTIKDTCHSREM
jgi:hypothetical protein